MRALLLGLASLAALASPGLAAATFEWEGHTVKIEPGKAYEQELSCKAGNLVSGGYSLDSVNRGKGPRSKILVVENGPIPDDKWRVGFYNDGKASALIDFRISILCDQP
jgi:hypothetical protein